MHTYTLIYTACFSLSDFLNPYGRLWVQPQLYKWPSFVPCDGWVVLPCAYGPHLFIHSSADGHMDCCHVVAIGMSAAVNVGMHVVCPELRFSHGICSVVDAGSCGTSHAGLVWILRSCLFPTYSRIVYVVCIFLFSLSPTCRFASLNLEHQFSSVQSLSCVRLFVTPWIAPCQASLSITNSQSSLRLTSIESVMPSSHLILCRPLLLLPSIPPSIRVFSSESTLQMRWPKYWSFSFSIILSKEIPGLISFRMDWLDLLAVQGLSRVFSNTTVQKHQFFGV